MSSRIEYANVAPGAYRAMLGLEKYLHDCGLAAPLLELVKMRASQVNGWNRLGIAFRSQAGAYQAGTCSTMLKKT